MTILYTYIYRSYVQYTRHNFQEIISISIYLSIYRFIYLSISLPSLFLSFFLFLFLTHAIISLCMQITSKYVIGKINYLIMSYRLQSMYINMSQTYLVHKLFIFCLIHIFVHVVSEILNVHTAIQTYVQTYIHEYIHTDGRTH